MQINGRRIGTNERPVIVAELSANHNGSLSRALQIITAAREAGADRLHLPLVIVPVNLPEDHRCLRRIIF